MTSREWFTPGDTSWMDAALCAQVDPAPWFPVKWEPSKPAKAICARCPVRGECRSYALARPGLWGIWGGTTERERRQIQSAKRRPEAGEVAA